MTDLIMYQGSLYHAEDFSDDFLAHYGVKGMKWGVRRSRGGYIGKASRAKGSRATKQRTPEQAARRKQIAKRVAIGAGAAALATAAAYGAYKYGGSPNAAMNRYVTGTNAKIIKNRTKKAAANLGSAARGRAQNASNRIGERAAMGRYVARTNAKIAKNRVKNSAAGQAGINARNRIGEKAAMGRYVAGEID